MKGNMISGALRTLLASFAFLNPTFYASAQAPRPFVTRSFGRSRTPGKPGRAGDKLARLAAKGKVGVIRIR